MHFGKLLCTTLWHRAAAHEGESRCTRCWSSDRFHGVEYGPPRPDLRELPVAAASVCARATAPQSDRVAATTLADCVRGRCIESALSPRGRPAHSPRAKARITVQHSRDRWGSLEHATGKAEASKRSDAVADPPAERPWPGDESVPDKACLRGSRGGDHCGTYATSQARAMVPTR
jgi:hypothetical protein